MPTIPGSSELEGCVLGVVWLQAPTTPYMVRMRFAASKSAWWSGSAGTIYPLLRRLEKRGLVRSTPLATGRRAATHYHITPVGKRVLRTWLWSRVDADEVADFDPLRHRVRFLAALPPPERARFIRVAREGLLRLESHAKKVHDADQRKTDVFGYLAGRGVWHTARARRAWLDEVEETLRVASPLASERRARS